MITTEPLEQILTEPGTRELSLDDRRLDEVLSHADHNRFLQSAEAAQALWRSQIYDVRTLGSYLFGVFLERGMTSLTLLFECVRRAIKDNLAYLSPTHKRERHLDVSLRWLFDGIITQTRHHERQKDAVWTKWTSEWLQSVQQNALQVGRSLLTTIEEILPGATCRQPLLHLLSLLETMATTATPSAGWDMSNASVIPAPPPPPDETPPSEDGDDDDDDADDDDSDSKSDDDDDDDDDSDSKSDDDDDDDDDSDSKSDDDDDDDDDSDSKSDDDDDSDSKSDDESASKSDDNDDDDDDEKESSSADSASQENPSSESRDAESGEPPSLTTDPPSGSPMPERGQPTTSHAAATIEVPVGPTLASLLQALAGFLTLVNKQRFRQAAILSQHITYTLTHTDVSELLPSLFVDYLIHLARHSERLKSFLAKEQDLESETLRKLCRADLRRFLEESER
jgi:hypothetical protein